MNAVRIQARRWDQRRHSCGLGRQYIPLGHAMSKGGQRHMRGLAFVATALLLVAWSIAGSKPAMSLLNTLRGHTNSVMSVTVTPDGRQIISASGDGTIRIWDLQSGALMQTLGQHEDVVRSVAITHDGRKLVSGSTVGDVLTWNLGSVAKPHSMHESGSVIGVAVTSNGQHAAAGNKGGSLYIWGLDPLSVKHQITAHADDVTSISVTRDGEYILTGGGESDPTIKLWNISSGALVRTFTGHTSSVWSIVTTPDGCCVISGGSDKSIRLWDLQNGQSLGTFVGHEHPVYSLAISPDGNHIVSGGESGRAKIWEIERGPLPEWLTKICSVCRETWRPKPGALVRSFEAHDQLITGLVVTPDGQKFVTASADSTIKIWALDAP